jgi:hypothetical protein
MGNKEYEQLAQSIAVLNENLNTVYGNQERDTARINLLTSEINNAVIELSQKSNDMEILELRSELAEQRVFLTKLVDILNRMNGVAEKPRDPKEELKELIGSQPKGENVFEAYCTKCKAKRALKDFEKDYTDKFGKVFSVGKCSVCGTRVLSKK